MTAIHDRPQMLPEEFEEFARLASRVAAFRRTDRPLMALGSRRTGPVIAVLTLSELVSRRT